MGCSNATIALAAAAFWVARTISLATVAVASIACHPVLPALAAALSPSIKMMASALEALFPNTAGAPALTASMAAFLWTYDLSADGQLELNESKSCTDCIWNINF